MWERAPRQPALSEVEGFRQAQGGGFLFHETLLKEHIVKVRKRSREVFLQERLCKTLFCGLQAPCLPPVTRRSLRPVEIVKFGKRFRKLSRIRKYGLRNLCTDPGTLWHFWSDAKLSALRPGIPALSCCRVQPDKASVAPRSRGGPVGFVGLLRAGHQGNVDPARERIDPRS